MGTTWPSDLSSIGTASNWPTAIHELTDAVELRRRFEAVIAARVAAGRAALPMPERWLADIAGRLPDSTGVALGFDRLVMLATGAESIDEVASPPRLTLATVSRPMSCDGKQSTRWSLTMPVACMWA